MPIITLTTDLGLKDYYVAAIKGAILSEIEHVNIVDFSHEIEKFNIVQTAFVVKNASRYFPKNTIHVIGVLPQRTPDIAHLAIEYDNQFFIGADNGIFSLIFEKPPTKVVAINIYQDTDLLTFPTKDVFVKAACHLARGGSIDLLGKQVNAINERSHFMAVVGPNSIRGIVAYVDSYGNLISNISKSLFNEVRKNRPFTITFRKPAYDITEISNNYSDVIESEVLALFGSSGFLEIAINIGHASNLMGIKVNDVLTILFDDDF